MGSTMNGRWHVQTVLEEHVNSAIFNFFSCALFVQSHHLCCNALFDALIGACAKGKQAELALERFEAMRGQGVALDAT